MKQADIAMLGCSASGGGAWFYRWFGDSRIAGLQPFMNPGVTDPPTLALPQCRGHKRGSAKRNYAISGTFGLQLGYDDGDVTRNVLIGLSGVNGYDGAADGIEHTGAYVADSLQSWASDARAAGIPAQRILLCLDYVEYRYAVIDGNKRLVDGAGRFTYTTIPLNKYVNRFDTTAFPDGIHPNGEKGSPLLANIIAAYANAAAAARVF